MLDVFLFLHDALHWFFDLVQEVMLRRLKRDVMAELPPKRRQVVRLPRPKPADWPNQEVPEGECFLPLLVFFCILQMKHSVHVICVI